jgi:hypothetical protein
MGQAVLFQAPQDIDRSRPGNSRIRGDRLCDREEIVKKGKKLLSVIG